MKGNRMQETKKVSKIEYEVQNRIESFDDVNYVGKEQIESATPQVSLETRKEANFVQNPLTDKYQSIDLPSGFIFYPFDTLSIRKFEVRDLAKMSKVHSSGSYKLFKEVIQGCIDRDINQLTAGDFKYICYWLRLNSYPKTPMSVEWLSKYGNKNIALVRKEELEIYAPDITKEQLQEWRNKGFEIPTLKFSDIFDTDLPEEQDFMYSNAQYFAGQTWEEKISNMESYLEKNGLEALNETQEFDKLIDHGVKEKLTVVDSKFDPEEYKKRLEEKIRKLKLTINNIIKPESEQAAMLGVMLDKYQSDYAKLIKKLNEGEVVQAEPEEIFLEVDAVEFLSPVLAAVN